MAAAAGQAVIMPAVEVAEAAVSPERVDMARLSLGEASRAVRRGDLTSLTLVQACLARIDRDNPEINAVIASLHAAALADAVLLDGEARAGRFRSPLHGIPIALKDNIDTAGVRTSNASALVGDDVAAHDARVVQWLKGAGAIVIAKTNLAEFSLTPTSVTSHYGPVRNPWDTARVSGGSSGGSAAAVAAGMCFGALGTDSGGSIRLPAAWCGLVGLKPTAGLVPLTGIGPGLPMLDNCGPLGRTVEDVALLLTQMVGFDMLDPMSVSSVKHDYAAILGTSVSGLRVGVPRRPFFERLDPEVATAVGEALIVIGALTAGLVDVDLKGMEPSDPLVNAVDIYGAHAADLEARADLYQPTTRRSLRLCRDMIDGAPGTSGSATMVRYLTARNELFRRQRTADSIFDGLDVIVAPTMKLLPPTVVDAARAERGPGADEQTLALIENTYIFNILGLPAITVPCGFSREGLPIGLMISGRRFSEATLLALAAAYERSTPWHERRPPNAH